MATISRDIKERKEVKEKETKRRRTIKTEARAPSPEVPSKKVKVDAKHGPPPAVSLYNIASIDFKTSNHLWAALSLNRNMFSSESNAFVGLKLDSEPLS